MVRPPAQKDNSRAALKGLSTVHKDEPDALSSRALSGIEHPVHPNIRSIIHSVDL